MVYIPGELDKFLVGLAAQPSQKFDNIVSDEVTNHLFQAKDKRFGMDLVALNLQRGRDHGIPGYNAFRELCGLNRVKNFNGFADVMPKQIVERLKLIYKDVDDVDLFIGGISETPVPGALLGPTFRCLVGDQFKRLVQGDRYFYDTGDNPGKFTESQLIEIRHANLARITCDNGDDIHHMQPLAFKKPSKLNPLVPCDALTIPILDLLPWQDSYEAKYPKKTSRKNLSSSKLVSRPPQSPFNYQEEPRGPPRPAPTLSKRRLSRFRNPPFQSRRPNLPRHRY